MRAAVPGTLLNKYVCFEPVSSEGESIVWEIQSPSQFVLSFENSDQAELEKESLAQEKVRTTAVHSWREILETLVTPLCCLFKKCCTLVKTVGRQDCRCACF